MYQVDVQCACTVRVHVCGAHVLYMYQVDVQCACTVCVHVCGAHVLYMYQVDVQYMYSTCTCMWCTCTVQLLYIGDPSLLNVELVLIGEYENIKDRIASFQGSLTLHIYMYSHCGFDITLAQKPLFSLRLSSKVKHYCQEGMRLGFYSYNTTTNTN